MEERLFLFLTEGAERVSITVFPGDMCSKVADVCGHLVETAIYQMWEAGKGMQYETGTV